MTDLEDIEFLVDSMMDMCFGPYEPYDCVKDYSLIFDSVNSCNNAYYYLARVEVGKSLSKPYLCPIFDFRGIP